MGGMKYVQLISLMQTVGRKITRTQWLTINHDSPRDALCLEFEDGRFIVVAISPEDMFSDNELYVVSGDAIGEYEKTQLGYV